MYYKKLHTVLLFEAYLITSFFTESLPLKMPIHIGKKIREEVDKQNIPITTFAKKISRSRNVVYDIFERESVDTGLLNKIGKVLNCDFFSVYSAQKEYTQDGFKHFYVREPEVSYKSQEESRLQQQNQMLKTEITYLKKIISLFEKEAKSAKKTSAATKKKK
jgi:hypothetical protein